MGIFDFFRRKISNVERSESKTLEGTNQSLQDVVDHFEVNLISKLKEIFFQIDQKMNLKGSKSIRKSLGPSCRL